MRSHPVLVHSRTTAAQPKCHNIHSNVIYCNTRSYQQMASYTAAVHPPPSTIGRCVCVCRCENHCYCDGATQHIVRVTSMCVCIMHSVDVLWYVCSRARARITTRRMSLFLLHSFGRWTRMQGGTLAYVGWRLQSVWNIHEKSYHLRVRNHSAVCGELLQIQTVRNWDLRETSKLTDRNRFQCNCGFFFVVFYVFC